MRIKFAVAFSLAAALLASEAMAAKITVSVDGNVVAERTLSDADVATVQQWVTETRKIDVTCPDNHCLRPSQRAPLPSEVWSIVGKEMIGRAVGDAQGHTRRKALGISPR